MTQPKTLPEMVRAWLLNHGAEDLPERWLVRYHELLGEARRLHPCRHEPAFWERAEAQFLGAVVQLAIEAGDIPWQG